MQDDLSLDALGIIAGTNKSSLLVDYLRHYERIFGHLRHEEMDVIEIGIDQGASLALWRRYFTKARIVGVDIHEECKKHASDRVVVETGSSSDLHMLVSLARKYSPKIIIDDGSHIVSDIMVAFTTLFPFLRPGGIYIMEDLYHHYGEGSQNFVKNAPIAPGEFVFSIAQNMLAKQPDSAENYGLRRYLFDEVDGIEFFPAALAIRKKEKTDEGDEFRNWIRALEGSEQKLSWSLFSPKVYHSHLPARRKAELLQLCTQRNPGDLYSYHYLAGVLEQLGDLEGAITAAKKALSLSVHEENVKAARHNLDNLMAKSKR